MQKKTSYALIGNSKMPILISSKKTGQAITLRIQSKSVLSLSFLTLCTRALLFNAGEWSPNFCCDGIHATPENNNSNRPLLYPFLLYLPWEVALLQEPHTFSLYNIGWLKNMDKL